MKTHLENYLKSIYSIGQETDGTVSTNAIAARLEMKASSVTDMLKKLDEQGYVRHTKYQGAELTSKGRKIAVSVIRKHRLWEMFLVEKLGFTWDEVHEVAEQLEHVQSDKLIERLDGFLGYPSHDPHGDPIPDSNGKFTPRTLIALHELQPGKKAVVRGVKDHSAAFLRHLTMLELMPGQKIRLHERLEYDSSCQVERLPSRQIVQISATTSQHLLIQEL